MAFYSYIFSANTKAFKEKLKKVAKKENKNYYLLLLDTYYSVVKYGVGITEYLNYQFYLKRHQEKKEYAGIKLQNKFYEIVSPSQFKSRYTLKPHFLEDFKEYTKRDFIVPDKVKFKDFEIFLKKHKVFISKPFDGLGGADVKKVHTKDIKNLRKYFDECKKNRIFLEELIKQHDDMNKLCKTSCNTMRIMTFNNDGKSVILWAGLRIGNGINSVDNFHAGGMATDIDLKTGKLLNNAIDKDLKEYEIHPVTKTKIKGFIIPRFEEVKEMVLKAALESNKIKVVGWDVSITDKGPVIVEGNRRPGFDIVQVTSKKGRKDIINYVLDELKNDK